MLFLSAVTVSPYVLDGSRCKTRGEGLGRVNWKERKEKLGNNLELELQTLEESLANQFANHMQSLKRKINSPVPIIKLRFLKAILK